MIENPVALLLLFVAIVSSLYFLTQVETFKKIFRYLPLPFWCYFLPAIISTLGWIPQESPLYSKLSRFLLPACLILILLGATLAPLIRLGVRTLGTMIAASFAIFSGGLLSFFLLLILSGTSPNSESAVGELWKGWGCLAASWNGGSANMVAVKEILKTPETIFSNLIVVDVVVAYGWMAFLMVISKTQGKINKFLGATGMEEVDRNADFQKRDSSPAIVLSAGNVAQNDSLSVRARANFSVALLALICGQALWSFSQFLPEWGAILNRMTWTVIFATLLPILVTIPLEKKLQVLNTANLGNFLLYLLLASMGAKANLTSLFSAPIFVALGFFWITVHALTLFTFGKFFHIPISLLACASQANVGGPVSAPIVAAVYNKNLVPAAVLLAVLGAIYGTGMGLVLAETCRRMMNFII